MEIVFLIVWFIGFGSWAYTVAEQIEKPNPTAWFFLGGFFSWITMLVLYSHKTNYLNEKDAQSISEARNNGEQPSPNLTPIRTNYAGYIIVGLIVLLFVGRIIFNATN